MALHISASLSIPDAEIDLSFVRAAGPGGQNVNKLATAAQLRFDVRQSSALSDVVKERLLKLAGQRASSQGVISIKAFRFRTQERNRDDALERLATLIRSALVAPKPRLKTKVPRSVKRARLENKQRRSAVKSTRRAPIHED
ncbi:MAG: alternative ribosome rescue aminoacyl-tRNA hydrolase ArfB [Gammaproteobacteria bacterium]